MLRKAAIAYLDMLFMDICAGANLWHLVLKIEQRFRLQGYLAQKQLALERAIERDKRRFMENMNWDDRLWLE